MAIYRKIHTTFWSDSFISELTNDQKLFYLYILTNERTKQCGIYEITKRQIAFDLSCNIDTVSKHLKFFIDKGKLKYSDSTNEIAIKNWRKFNISSSPKVTSCIENELKDVKNKVLIEYTYSIDTQTQEEETQEEEQEQTETQDKHIFLYNPSDVERVYSAYPTKCPIKKIGSTGKSTKNKDKIKILLKTHTADELIGIIKTYVDGCIKSNTWIKNFSTFLTNLPDLEPTKEESEEQTKIDLLEHYREVLVGHVTERDILVIHPKYLAFKEKYGIDLEDYIINSQDAYDNHDIHFKAALDNNYYQKR